MRWGELILYCLFKLHYNSNPELGSTTQFNNECDTRRDEGHGYDGHQRTEDTDMFETETASQTCNVLAPNKNKNANK